MLSLLIRLLTLVLTAGVIVFAGVFGYAWYAGGKALDEAQAEGWLTPAPVEAPLSVFETTAAKGIFGATWDETGIPCRTAARFTLHQLGQADLRGPSISQVMARDILSRTNAERSLNGQIEELSLACLLESRHSDGDLLKLWMRRANFGGVTGPDDASQALFGKAPAELTAAESARFGALLSWPDSRSDTAAWDARARRMASAAAAN